MATTLRDALDQNSAGSKSSLLSQLQIDRGAPPGDGERPFRWWFLVAMILVLVMASLLWFLIARPDRPLVQVVEAKATSATSGAGGGSLLDASGYVVARRASTVSSKITGKVAEVLIEEGQHVDAGQVLARLDASNALAALAQADAQVAAAQASLGVAKLALDQAGPRDRRMERLHAAGYLSDQSIEDSRGAYENARDNVNLAQRQAEVSKAGREVARRNLDDTVIRAPFSGVVTVKAAQPGEMVSPISAGGGFTRTGIGTIVDMGSLEVEVEVSESFINRVHQGMPAVVKLNAYPDWEIPAEVIAVIPTANRSKATVLVRVGLKALDSRIVPDMGTHVSFLAPAGMDAGTARRSIVVVVPPDAVQATGPDRGVTFVVRGARLERRVVLLGAADGDGQRVRSGLAPGDKVVIGNIANLKDGVHVRIGDKPRHEDDEN